MRRILHFLGSTAFTGMFPFAPATVSTAFLLLLLIVFQPGATDLRLYTLIALFISVPIASRMEADYGKDPSECTIDEVAGFLLPLALLGVDLSTAGIWRLLIVAFFLFRFFDIAKVWPGKRLEGLPSGWGIVADDLMAGIYTFLSLKILSLWIPWI
ncbi:MAG: phosphatidylglycerophosphatase A [Candidatus Krumholzibacteria bacterium]|jgi:phosphatidylglycerophosphatase A|nr:phosphatidylglycerophosphatase A [Candidatus Krumholzibacteria bacterium]MDP6669327.1 phosphatidylglycerophosphatase A [Candidatus Krumholzibacteria bacterium]MDP6796766.1 phosphatidylglycerophosphatase A [Candidatus Krumholzibacteria bacterium]MDP7021680.1 phosphatidylglycerophosphatase A [Candidatus Krumholzibacteria bacterium]